MTGRRPRVWLNGDTVPAGVWVYVVDEEDPEEMVTQLDAYTDCLNGNLGPLVEVILPDRATIDALVEAATAGRG